MGKYKGLINLNIFTFYSIKTYVVVLQHRFNETAVWVPATHASSAAGMRFYDAKCLLERTYGNIFICFVLEPDHEP